MLSPAPSHSREEEEGAVPKYQIAAFARTPRYNQQQVFSSNVRCFRLTGTATSAPF